jgi:4-hydroxy-3-polyprenylbenzoate decarboxylase
MANPDLRDWLAQMEAAGELQKVSGASREEEIGGIVDIYQRAANNKAVLFDDIPGFPRGYRVAANILTGVKRIALTMGMPAHRPRSTWSTTGGAISPRRNPSRRSR